MTFKAHLGLAPSYKAEQLSQYEPVQSLRWWTGKVEALSEQWLLLNQFLNLIFLNLLLCDVILCLFFFLFVFIDIEILHLTYFVFSVVLFLFDGLFGFLLPCEYLVSALDLSLSKHFVNSDFRSAM